MKPQRILRIRVWNPEYRNNAITLVVDGKRNTIGAAPSPLSFLHGKPVDKAISQLLFRTNYVKEIELEYRK